jgi:hypothetical protein
VGQQRLQFGANLRIAAIGGQARRAARLREQAAADSNRRSNNAICSAVIGGL